MDSVGNPSTARSLNPGETFYRLVDRVCSTNFTVAARLSGPLSLDALITGLSAVQHGRPLLVVAARKDSLIPIKAVRKTAAMAPAGELAEYDIGHFEIYVGEALRSGRGAGGGLSGEAPEGIATGTIE